MTSDADLLINLHWHRTFDVTAVLIECRHGYAATALQSVAGVTEAELATIETTVKTACTEDKRDKDVAIALPRPLWLKLYHCMNAVMYELGPEELTTITSRDVTEILSTNRLIFAALFSRKCPAVWDQDIKNRC